MSSFVEKFGEEKRRQLESLFRDTMRAGRITPYQMQDRYCWSTSDDYLYEQELDDMLSEHGVSWTSAGASKLVFKMEDESDWVFKIPLFGESWYDDYEDEYPCFQDEFYNIARYFEFDKDDADNRPDSSMWNYCELEEYIGGYVSRFYPDLAPMFAKTYHIGWFGDVPVYVSECCETSWLSKYTELTNSQEYKSAFSKSATQRWSSAHRTAELSTAQKVCFDLSWGEELSCKLCQLIQDIHISDLHGGNVAYDREGKLRIIDYSGYVCASS